MRGIRYGPRDWGWVRIVGSKRSYRHRAPRNESAAGLPIISRGLATLTLGQPKSTVTYRKVAVEIFENATFCDKEHT